MNPYLTHLTVLSSSFFAVVEANTDFILLSQADKNPLKQEEPPKVTNNSFLFCFMCHIEAILYNIVYNNKVEIQISL